MPDIARNPDPATRLPLRTSGPISMRTIERRNVASREALRRRVGQEYHDMPGLCLTLAQARRLFGLREDICARVLAELIQAELLRVDAHGTYVRSTARP